MVARCENCAAPIYWDDELGRRTKTCSCNRGSSGQEEYQDNPEEDEEEED
jgi:hypothetical protein